MFESKGDKIASSIKHVSLIIGNETRGISSDMEKCCDDILQTNKTFNISNVRICLNNGIESLNCAIAFAIIGFEIKKIF
jgi:tRNA G18 (ribose-2'-O)-methylase SpoU